MAYWVVGGEFTDTQFVVFAPGKAEERLGPYAAYKDALEAWHAKAWATVDNCNARYRIVSDDD